MKFACSVSANKTNCQMDYLVRNSVQWSSLRLDDTFQLVTPVIDGTVNRSTATIFSIFENCTLELLY